MTLPALQVTVPNVANALLQAEQIGGAALQRQELQQRGRSRNALLELTKTFGGLPQGAEAQQKFTNAVAQTDPAAAMGFQEKFGQMAGDRQARASQEAQVLGQVFSGVNDQTSYDRALGTLTQAGIDMPFPPQFDPALIGQIMTTAQALAPPGEPFTLSPGQGRFGPQGQPIASLPAAPAAGPGAADQFKNANTLRDEFVKQTDSFAEAQTGLQRVEVGAAQNSGQGDVALIFGFMKTIDPSSTVREGEFATAEQTGSIDQQIVGRYNRLLSGERLTPEQRKGFVEAAQAQFAAQRQTYDQTVSEYTRLANQFGLPPANVIIERAVQRGAGARGPSPSAANVSTMTLSQLRGLDIDTLTAAERDAVSARLTELGF